MFFPIGGTIEFGVFAKLRLDSIKLGDEFPRISHVIISSVSDFSDELTSFLNSKFKNVMLLDRNTELPFKIEYKTPETLGKDRIAIVAGADYIFPKHNVLAIDMGTAITYDFLTSNGVYLGGNISPGMQIRYKALNSFTENTNLYFPATPIFTNNGTETSLFKFCKVFIE